MVWEFTLEEVNPVWEVTELRVVVMLYFIPKHVHAGPWFALIIFLFPA